MIFGCLVAIVFVWWKFCYLLIAHRKATPTQTKVILSLLNSTNQKQVMEMRMILAQVRQWCLRTQLCPLFRGTVKEVCLRPHWPTRNTKTGVFTRSEEKCLNKHFKFSTNNLTTLLPTVLDSIKCSTWLRMINWLRNPIFKKSCHKIHMS